MTSFRPLEGVRVLALEVAASLPAGTRTLGDLGADVLRIAEPAGQTSPYTRVFDSSLMNKRSIVLDLRHERSRELARRLARAADVVCYNFRPHVPRQFGLGPEELLAENERLIVVQLTGYGTPGPWSAFPAYGPSVEAAGGMNAMMGEPGDLPQRVGGGVFADTLGGRYAALAVCGALVRRAATGRGGYIDVSMYEAIVTGVGNLIVEAGQTGAAPERRGNRSAHFAPQGVYPALGEEEWVAISVMDDEQWSALVGLLAAEELARPDYASVEGRRAAHDAIDGVIAAWTATRTKDDAAAALQGAGVAAGPVNRTRDLPLDPQYAASGFFQQVRHDAPILGYVAHPHMRMPGQFAGYARPDLTDHQPEGTGGLEAVAAWLGMTAGEVQALADDGTIGAPRRLLPPESKPPELLTARRPAKDDDFAERLGLPAAPTGS